MVEIGEEDAEALQEKLKNMSPEQLKEYQKQQCIFCHIISGKVASKKVYEDEYCIAVLDINPANPGHVLIIPKEHYPIMPLIPDDIIQHLGIVSKAISQALLKSLKLQGTTIFIANGVAAGQKAQHFMIHVIPRKEGDNVGLIIPKGQIPDNLLEQIRVKLIAKVNEMFGIKEESQEVSDKNKTKKKEKVEKEENKNKTNKKEKEEKVEKEENKNKTNKKEKSEKGKQREEDKEEDKEEGEDKEVSLDDIAELLK